LVLKTEPANVSDRTDLNITPYTAKHPIVLTLIFKMQPD
jgi:hypothetical protein